MAAPLLPCAHCGASARWYEYKDSFENYVHAVSCTECPSEMSYHVDALPMDESVEHRDAIIREAWNGRATAAPDMLEALPDLSYVINWLENGCDVSEAVKELRIYKARIDAAIAKAKGQ